MRATLHGIGRRYRTLPDGCPTRLKCWPLSFPLVCLRCYIRTLTLPGVDRLPHCPHLQTCPDILIASVLQFNRPGCPLLYQRTMRRHCHALDIYRRARTFGKAHSSFGTLALHFIPLFGRPAPALLTCQQPFIAVLQKDAGLMLGGADQLAAGPAETAERHKASIHSSPPARLAASLSKAIPAAAPALPCGTCCACCACCASFLP